MSFVGGVGERRGSRNLRGRRVLDAHAMGFDQGRELLGCANVVGGRRALDDADTARGVYGAAPV